MLALKRSARGFKPASWPEIEVAGETFKAFRVRLCRHSKDLWSEFTVSRVRLWRESGQPEDLIPIETEVRLRYGVDRFPPLGELAKFKRVIAPRADELYESMGGLDGLRAALMRSRRLQDEFWSLVLKGMAEGGFSRVRRDAKKLVAEYPNAEDIVGKKDVGACP